MNTLAAPAAVASTSVEKSALEEFKRIPLDEISPSLTSLQALRRSRFDKAALAELASDIKRRGVMQPILVRPGKDSAFPKARYQICAGERRYLAAFQAGLTEIPAVIKQMTEVEVIESQMAENLQREDYHELEEAEGFDQLAKALKCSAKDLVAHVGKNEAHIHARLKLLALCKEVRERFYAGELNASVALLIARLSDSAMQIQAAEACISGKTPGMNARTPYGEPLVFSDAKQYIELNFLRKLEGTAEINKARAAGKPVLTGKDAEKVWKSAHSDPIGFVQLNDVYYDSTKQATVKYKDVLGEAPAGVVLVQSPFTGEAVACLPDAAVVKVFNDKKIKLPYDLQPKEQSAPPAGKHPAAENTSARAKEEAAQAGLEIERKIKIATFKAIRQKYPAKFGKLELLDLLAFLRLNSCADLDAAVVPTRNPKPADTEKEIVGFILDHMYASQVHAPFYDIADMLPLIKRYGIDAAKIRKEITAADKAAAAPKPKAAVKKPAAKKSPAKPKAAKPAKKAAKKS